MKGLKIISRGKHTIIVKNAKGKKKDKIVCVKDDIIPYDDVKAKERGRYEVVDVSPSEIKGLPEEIKRGPGRP